MSQPVSRMTLEELEAAFDQNVFGFLQSDIERELRIAEAQQGAGNWLCALALLAATEYLGTLAEGSGVPKVGPMVERANKRRFLEGYYRMGEKYANEHRQGADPWELRNDFIHAFATKSAVIVGMKRRRSDMGLHWKSGSQSWTFVVHNYLQDYLKAAERLRAEIRTALAPLREARRSSTPRH